MISFLKYFFSPPWQQSLFPFYRYADYLIWWSWLGATALIGWVLGGATS